MPSPLIDQTHLFDSIPVREIYPAGAQDAPLVIVLHGFSGSKDAVAERARPLAAAGFRLLLVDARLHGDRRPDDFEQQFRKGFSILFGRVVEGTAEDVGRLIDRFAPGGPVALVGISMGAWATYLVASQDPRVTVACPMIGSPYLYWESHATGAEQERIAHINVSTHPERLTSRCALLIQHGALDKLVPIAEDQKLYERLLPLYADAPERLRFIPYPDSGHDVTPAMVSEVATWLLRFL